MNQMAPQNDPNVVLPAAVRRQAASANKFFGPDGKRLQPGQELAAAAPPTPPAPEPQAAPPAPAPVDWERKFHSAQGNLDTLKGRFDVQAEQLNMAAERISNMERMLSTMNSAPAAPVASLVTPEEQTSYGAEFLDIIGRQARDVLNPEVADLKSQVENLTRQLEGVGAVVQRSAREKMFDHMDANLKEWRVVNTTPEFISWLGLPDPFSGVIRQKMLTAAFEQNDTPRVMAFFSGFLAQQAAVAPSVPLAPSPNQPGSVSLDSLAAPGRARSSAAPAAPAEKPQISRKNISLFYTEVAAGKWKGRDDEKNQVEQAIFLAQNEGRIIP